MFCIIPINGDGFRSQVLSFQRPPSSLRILCLGDSQTFGNGVAQDETYPAKLESQLSSRKDARPVEVINAGIQGYEIQQEVKLLERITLTRPDLVTIGFYLNDISEILTSKHREIIDGEFKDGGSVKQFVPYRLIYALKRSRLVTLLYWRYRIFQSDAEGNPLKEILLGKTPAKFAKSWQLIEEALLQAKKLALAHHFRLIVFPVPTGEEFLMDYPNEDYRSRLLALADRLEIESFDPTPEMKSAGGGFDRYFITWDGHINSVTHALIAQLLADRIAPRDKQVTNLLRIK